MSPNSSLNGKVPQSVTNENAYSDIDSKPHIGVASKKQPIKTVDQKEERVKLQEKYARLRKDRQDSELKQQKKIDEVKQQQPNSKKRNVTSKSQHHSVSVMKSSNPSEKSLVISRAPSIREISSKTKKPEDQKKNLIGLTFDDIQNMHYSNLNTGDKTDVFNP